MDTREKIYRFVCDRLGEGRPPSIREVQAAMGLRAVESARAHLEALVGAGRLRKQPGARGYALPDGDARGGAARRAPGYLSAPVPLLGRVQAGMPSTAVEDLEGYLPTDGSYPPEEMFALTVQGSSMSGAGILPGDVVLVRRQGTALSGEIVVAMVEDDATVKRLRLVAGRIELHPENPDFEVLCPAEAVILGKVVEVRRFLDGRRGRA